MSLPTLDGQAAHGRPSDSVARRGLDWLRTADWLRAAADPRLLRIR
jgi:hypothetical protein